MTELHFYSMQLENDEMDIAYEEIIENTETKCKGINQNKKLSNSRIFKCLLKCLLEKKHSHMLKFSNQNIFEIIYTNKKSPKWKKHDISLFKEMDALFSKPRKSASYEEDCKVRFRANLIKLCKSGFLECIDKWKESKSVRIEKYKILRYPADDKPNKTEPKRKKKSQLNMSNAVETVVNQTTVSSKICFVKGRNMASLSFGAGKNKIEANGLNEIKNVDYTTPNDIEANGLNEIDNVVYTTPNDIKGNGNHNGMGIYNSTQDRNAVDTTYNNVNMEVEPLDDCQKMISSKNPVLSSAWKMGDNLDQKIPNVDVDTCLEVDWMEDFKQLFE